ncbi:MAG TPA: helix-turn-helix transcriptional regulator [Bacillota bacterium]|nr:helix-turn-helix transcriptional regulator [Bacillota bacterium]
MFENKTSDLLIRLRKERNLTQKDLADALNVSFQAVSKWERGENLPDANLMLEIADFYHVTVDEILRGELLPKDDLKHRLKRKNQIMYSGIVIIILSVVPFLLLMNTHFTLGLVLLISVAIIGIGFVVFGSMMTIEGQSEDAVRFKRIENIVYPICFVIFFYVGMVYGLWYLSWLVFVLGYAVTMIFKKN